MGATKQSLIGMIMVLSTTSVGCGGDAGDEGSGSDQPGSIGLYALIRSPDSGAMTCAASTGVVWDLGTPSPTPGSGGPVSGSPGNPISGASCFVGSDGAFHVEAEGTDPQITPPDGMIRIEFEGMAQSNATFSADFYTPRTLQLSADPSCITTTVRPQEPGFLWIDFDCPLLVDVGRPSVGCHASGSLVLAGCGK